MTDTRIYQNDKRENVGIYIHIPFCLSKCHYCDFCSVSRVDGDVKQRYVDMLCREIEESGKNIAQKLDVDTVYFGGGTPSLLSVRQLERILKTVDDAFHICDGAEITLETNPKTADREKLSKMIKLGINRLSIGMQSANDRELRSLGRIHGFSDFVDCFNDAREVGFDNISADLMYGIPEQSKESFCHSVKTLCDMSPEHISSYCLTVEEGTNFYRRRDKLVFPDEDAVSDMYSEMSGILAENGYKKYEISNFSKPGRESKHNLKYWHCEDYLGFGPAAHSYFDGVRFAHSRDIDAYLKGESIIIDNEPIGANEAMNEYVMLGMRLTKGIDYSEFFTRFGVDFLQKYAKIKNYSPEFVALDAEGCCFTEKGMFVSNYVLSDILEFGE